jgi:hypothetical protein
VTGNVGGLDVSADGAKVLVRFGGGVYLRALDDDSLHAMAPGITREPRLSRDGRSILGGAEDVIVVVDVAGGQPHPVVQTEPLSRAVFGYDGFVYFDKGGGLSRIAMTGGSIDTLLRADSSGRAIIPMEALPDGRRQCGDRYGRAVRHRNRQIDTALSSRILQGRRPIQRDRAHCVW